MNGSKTIVLLLGLACCGGAAAAGDASGGAGKMAGASKAGVESKGIVDSQAAAHCASLSGQRREFCVAESRARTRCERYVAGDRERCLDQVKLRAGTY